jgi:hypothetical protein
MKAQAIFSSVNVKVVTSDPPNVFTGTGSELYAETLPGYVQTGNEAALFATTVSFTASVTNSYVYIVFYDIEGNILGNFQGRQKSNKPLNSSGRGQWANK